MHTFILFILCIFNTRLKIVATQANSVPNYDKKGFFPRLAADYASKLSHFVTVEEIAAFHTPTRAPGISHH